MEYSNLIKEAVKARENSYSPYSNFKVGAAVLGKSGKVYTGANIENASYGASICAERVACTRAIFEGEKEILAVAIVGSKKGALCYPCGICRQFLCEFGNPDIVLSKSGEVDKIVKLSELIPNSFTSSDMD